MKELLRCVAETDTASLQQVAAVLKTKTDTRRLQKVGTMFAATDHALLCRTGMKQGCQVLRAFTVVKNTTVSDARVAQWFLHRSAIRPFPTVPE